MGRDARWGDGHARGSEQLSRASERYDEDSVRVRAGRGSRPRTRMRPRHTDAVAGFVLRVDLGRYTCLVHERRVLATKARELGRRSIAVGDHVDIVGDVSGSPDALGRIVRVRPRTSALRRTADDVDPVERVIVANAGQLVVVSALADPGPRPRLIDRCLVAAYDAGLDPLLCLTKSDLKAPDELLRAYEPLGVPSIVTHKAELAEAVEPADPTAEPDSAAQPAPTAQPGSATQPAGAGVGELRDRLTGRISVLVGHSGVGKSTLVNALAPGADRATGTVNAATGRGRHVSSSAVALALRDQGWVIDTPGVRSFGLAHVSPADVTAAFPDLAEGAERCPRGCGHTQQGCALDAWVAEGGADPARLDSLRRLLRSREGE